MVKVTSLRSSEELDAALDGNVQNFEDKFGSQARTDDDKRPPTGGL